MNDDTIRADWLVDEGLPHRGEYVVMEGNVVLSRVGPFGPDWETAKRIARALRYAGGKTKEEHDD